MAFNLVLNKSLNWIINKSIEKRLYWEKEDWENDISAEKLNVVAVLFP